MVVKLFSTKKTYFVSASFFIVRNVCGYFGSNPVSATKKRPFGRLVAESTGLRDAVALSHKTSKFAIAALRLCSLRCFVPLQTFFAGAAAKKRLAGLSVRALYPPQKKRPYGRLVAESTGLEPVHRYSR